MYLTLYTFRDWHNRKYISILERKGTQISQKSKSRSKILGPRRVTLASHPQILGASSKSSRRGDLALWTFTPYYNEWIFLTKILSIDKIKVFYTNLILLHSPVYTVMPIASRHCTHRSTGWAIFPHDTFSRLAPKVTRRCYLLLLLFCSHTSRSPLRRYIKWRHILLHKNYSIFVHEGITPMDVINEAR